jgi:hypothetical protein
MLRDTIIAIWQGAAELQQFSIPMDEASSYAGERSYGCRMKAPFNEAGLAC